MSQLEKTYTITESQLKNLDDCITSDKITDNVTFNVARAILEDVKKNDNSEIQRNSDYWKRALPYLRKTLTKQQFDELAIIVDKESMKLLQYLTSNEERPAK